MARLEIIIPPRWVTHGEGDHAVRPSSTWRAFLGGAAYVNPVHTALQHIQRVWFGPKQPGLVGVSVGRSYLKLRFRKREALVIPATKIKELLLDEYYIKTYARRASLGRQHYTKWWVRTEEGERYVFCTRDGRPFKSKAVAALRRNWSDDYGVRTEGFGDDTTVRVEGGYANHRRHFIYPLSQIGAGALPSSAGPRSEPPIYSPQLEGQLGPEVEISTERIHFPLAELPTPFQPPRRPTALRDGAYQETPFRAGAIELTPRHIIVRLDDQPVRLYAYTELANLRIGLADIFRDCHLPSYEYESYRYADIAFSIPGQSFRYFVDNTHYKITTLSLGVKFLTGFNEVDAPEYKQEDVVHEPRYENRRYEARRIWLPRP